MQKQLEQLELEVHDRIYRLFREQFNDNKSAFARAANCSETTIRRIFANRQSITLPLLIKMSSALGVTASELLKNVELPKTTKET